ncbi:hypothetical protein PC118_g5226 [Phytophthora cactorum]|uniref:Uncharacterized protein n=2 Tax=Phytophthora cactorum TaxID=29920 RepID=A0A8T1GI85_9STRA|nr:hypothetical protein PC111_g5293 [Phytophthora cactorum]KAG2932726.1 hypothetical protein PC115_g5719 [Phytophthora cactorum]KAG2991204.1 hypothetical protein PC118_g5226 [Phytophthora cactorum]KAG3180806.1 hypothetical protein C6341_g6755 [Phytophthora cactorum]
MNASVSKRDKPPRECRRKGRRAERTSFAYEGTNTRTVGPTKLPRAEIELTSKQMSKGHLLTCPSLAPHTNMKFTQPRIASIDSVKSSTKQSQESAQVARHKARHTTSNVVTNAISSETLTLSRAIIGISVGVFIPALLQF